MPIHLIIDGYNLLGVRGGLRGDVEARREQLIRDLACYRQRKGHPVTVVFDGWRAGHPVEHVEWREGIGVVYSTVITSGDFETRLQMSGARPFARKQEADEEEPVRRDPKKKGNPKKLPKALRQKARQLKRF
ncbi:MAG: NYN domain-containing protein [Nitrospirae bacterium]|nr:MAG: NYN domain-containing protein [Nitrospirota bacterium]